MPGLSKTEIANLALLSGGQGLQIEDYDSDESAAAKAIRQAYPVARKIVLGEEDWHFARKSASLVIFNPDPDVAYNDVYHYAYHVPSNCVEFRGLELGGNLLKAIWELWDGEESSAAGLILTNEADAVGRYTFLQTNEARYPMWFCDALAHKTAELITPALTPGDYAKRLQVVQMRYREALSRARARNFNSDRASEPPSSEAERERA